MIFKKEDINLKDLQKYASRDSLEAHRIRFYYTSYVYPTKKLDIRTLICTACISCGAF